MSTLSVSKGYSTIEQEFEASLRRAFVDGKADFIRISNRYQQFQIESADYGVNKGWLNGTFHELDEQSSEHRYRLTEEGRAHFRSGQPMNDDLNDELARGQKAAEAVVEHMKTMGVMLVLVVLTAICPAQQPLPKAELHKIDRRIEQLKKKEILLDSFVALDNPSVKACRDAGWPNTEECRTRALAMMRTIQNQYVVDIEREKAK